VLVAVGGVCALRYWRQRQRFDTPIERARVLCKAHRYDEAIESFEAARQAKPDDPTVLRGLAECYKGKGQWAAAAAWVERAIPLDPTPRARLLAAEIELLAAGHWDPLAERKAEVTHAERLHLGKAIEQAQAAVRDYPEDCGPAHRILAEATARLGDLAKAIAHVQRAVEAGPDSRATRLLAARILVLDGKQEAAVGHCRHLVTLLGARSSLDPEEKADLLHALALGAAICADVKRYDEAVEMWEKYMAHGGDRATGWVGLATCHFLKGEFARAVEEGDRAAKLYSPKVVNTQLFTVRGLALLELKRYDRAVADLRVVALANPKDFLARYHLAMALLASADRNAAREALLEALQVEPRYLAAREELAKMMEADGQAKDALEQLRNAIRADPGARDPYQLLIRFASKHGLDEEVEAALFGLLRLDPRSPDVIAQLADLYLARGDAEKAHLRALRAVEVQRANPKLLHLLARTEAAMGRNDEAAAHFHQAVRERPDYEAAYLDWAAMHEAAGQHAAAHEVCERALKALPGSLSLQCAHARLCFASGRDDEGTNELGKALEALEKKAEKKPDEVLLRAALVDHLLSRGKKDDALAEAEKAIQRSPKSVEAHWLAARVRRARGEWDSFLAALEHIARNLGDEAGVLDQRLAGHVHEGHYDAAVEVGKAALQRDPSLRRRIEPLVEIARFFAGKADEAIETLRRLVSTDPFDCDAGFILSLMQLQRGDPLLSAPACREYALPDIALNAWTDLLERTRREPDKARRIARILLHAHVYESAGWHDTAAEHAEQILAFAPDCLIACCLAPVLWERAGDRAKAIALCERAVAQCKAFGYGRLLLADLFLLDGKPDRAKDLYAQHAAAEDAPFDARTKLALLASATGDTRSSVEAWRTILKSEPRHMPAANNLAWLLATQPEPDLEQASSAADQAFEAAPKDPAVLDTVGWVSYLRGETQRAVDRLEAAVGAAEHRALYHFHLGMAYARQRQTDKAEQELKKAIALAPQAPFVEQARQALRDLRP
jgi:tetratricopeptide (TPR) repeat protein